MLDLRFVNVALYARVSKAHSHQDPEVQLRELRAWCKTHEHVIAGEYVDRGVSGAKASRPQLDRMMQDAIRGRRDIEAIVVWRLDRFGRSLQHLQNAVAELLEAKIKFVSIKDGFDLTTPVGKLMFALLGAFAEFERNIIAERIHAGLKHARAKGVKLGRPRAIENAASRTTKWRRRKERNSA